VRELERKLASPLRQAVTGSLNRATRNRRPRHNEIDWLRTIRANLKHYQPEYGSVIPETRIGFGRKGQSLRDIRAVHRPERLDGAVGRVRERVRGRAGQHQGSQHLGRRFDTAVADLTPLLADPVEVLFGTHLGGGTDINRALSYCQGRVTS
jgi:hypothetical protein